ncbi:hypothetical protein N9C09_00390 [Aquiluna sp.]|nr:hypothetical protein [Aquiluna sp.]
MSKNNDTKKGLALGAIFGLIAGLFSAMPASAAPSTTAFTFDPAGAGTSFVTFVDEDFTMSVQRDISVISATDFATLKYDISFNSGVSHSFEVLAGTGSAAVAMSASSQLENLTVYGEQRIYYGGNTVAALNGNRQVNTFSQYVNDNDDNTVLATQSWVVKPSSFSSTIDNQISLRIIGENGFNLTTMSATVVATVRPFLDLNNNNKWDSASEPSAVQTVTFGSYASLAPTTSVAKGVAGDNHVTASVTLPAMNYGQLGGKFFVKWTYAGMNSTTSAISLSATAERTITDANYLTALSASLAVTAAQLGASWSASVGYVKDGVVFTTIGEALGIDQDFVSRTWGLGTSAAVARSIDDVGIYTFPTANQTQAGAARPNSTYVVTVTAHTASAVSVSAASIRLDFSGTGLTVDKTLAVNGGTPSTGSHGPVTVVTGADGTATATLVASGFAVGDTITITANQAGTDAESRTLTMTAPTWTLENDADLKTATPGSTVNVSVSVKDQWDVLSTRTDQQVWFTKGAPFDDANTVSKVAVVNGVATAALALTPATQTGSFAVTADLRTLNQNTGNYDATNHTDDSDGMNITVTGAANAFRTGLAASYSASISYGTDLSWSSTIEAAYVVVTASSVVVSGAGLMFRDANKLTSTASDSLTLVGTSTARVQFQVTARMAGTYTVTLTAGSATTTSLIVVNPARSDMGTTITWDTTAISAGRTKIVAGTLTDANGNPVYTDGPGGEGDVNDSATTASILVTYAGTAGIPVGSMPTETDADGKFRISVLTSGSDDGSFTLTAVYSADGTATAAADKVTSINTITVGDNVEAVDQKITVGSFKGYIAIYTKGYMGQKLSAKVAGKWLVVDPIAAWQGNDYSRAVRLTGAGYTILVHLYIDGEFVRSETIVTK